MITKCFGERRNKCPRRDKCHRYLAPRNHHESFFNSPFKGESCEYFLKEKEYIGLYRTYERRDGSILCRYE